MLASGAQINCVSQHIVQKYKFPVYFYDTPFKLGMAVEGDKYEVTSYTEIPYKIAQFSGAGTGTCTGVDFCGGHRAST
jgi:hypothetical protein